MKPTVAAVATLAPVTASTTLAAIGVLVLVNALAVGAMLFVRRRAPEGSYFTDGDRASGVFGLLGGGFAIFAGFVIFLAFTSYDNSRSASEQEANTLVQQYETAQFFPAAARAPLSGELVCYARSVVHREWPALQSGAAQNGLNPWGVAIFRTVHGVDPKSAAEQAAFAKFLDQTSDRENARITRLHGASGIIPASLWAVLILLSVVLFAYILFFADSAEPKRAQAMLAASTTTALVVTLLAVAALDNPYRKGYGGLRPVAMERSLDLIAQAAAVVGPVKAPCDAAGVTRSG